MRGLRSGNRVVRRPAVAGMFYEGDPAALAAQVDTMLRDAGPREPTAMTGVIVPHAGHIYSGPVAASAYRLLPRRVGRVVLIGPSHFVPLPAMAATGATAWRTPLGEVPVDADEVRRLAEDFPGAVVVDDRPHSREHCLEVQLPFLQRVLAEGWSLVPLVVGHAPQAVVAEVLGAALTDDADGTVLIVSTDLSHYQPYDQAAARDGRTARAISAQAADAIDDEDACGAYALRGALQFARERGLAVEQLDLRSSGDTAGPRDRVVGYGAFRIAAPEAPEDAAAARSGAVVPAQGRASHRAAAGHFGDSAGASDREQRIVALARRTIEQALRTGRQSIPSPLTLDADLRETGAAFVTLRSASTGELLGCVGSLEAYRPLGVDVAAHAIDAAFHDHRFSPVTADQAADLRIGVSVLGPLEAFPVTGYEDLVARVTRGKGLYICAGGYRATYLPSVWQELSTPGLFVASLWRKAGLQPGTWPSGMRAYTYEVAEFGE